MACSFHYEYINLSVLEAMINHYAHIYTYIYSVFYILNESLIMNISSDS